MKRVMAYSTVSQLGYMMLGLGAGAMARGMFHLFTHAFFKALLFLTAGSVIYRMGDARPLDAQDLRRMGGLRAPHADHCWTMVIAALSLAGIPPLAGFWSKDEILAATARGPADGAVYWRAAGVRPDHRLHDGLLHVPAWSS